MAHPRKPGESNDAYYRRTGELAPDDWGGEEPFAPGMGALLGDIGAEMLEDAVVDNMLPAKKGNQAQKDAKDAQNADSAFTGILAAAVAIMETTSVAAKVTGAGAPAGIAYDVMLFSAATAVRVAWAKMSVQDRANIWRGGV